MKILVLGDLHGQIPEIHFQDFDLIITPGDFCSGAARDYMFQALADRLKNPGKKTRWWQICGKKKAKEMLEQSKADGRKVLEKLNSIGRPVYIVPGNWEWIDDPKSEWVYLRKNHYTDLIKGLKNITDTQHKLVDVGEFQIIGHGVHSNSEFPQDKEGIERLKNQGILSQVKKQFEKESKLIESLLKKATKPVILLSHNVPYDTPLDMIVNPTSPNNGKHVGSVIVRNMIEKYQPPISIGGHIHEHFREHKMGKTIAINSGFGSKCNILIEFKGGKIKSIEFFPQRYG
jgi:Icc-related predicted phosphoesterase